MSMTSGAVQQPGRPEDAGRPLMSIGEVLNLLKDEFDDISVSKIRFLESEGLIAPERTASGYRKFSMRDVERLTIILRLQRDSFLPLKVIKQRLAAMDAGQPLDTSGPSRAEADVQPVQHMTVAAPLEAAPPPPPPPPPVDDLARALAPMRLTATDLAREAGLDAGEMKTLADLGVVCVHKGEAGEYYDEEDLEVARIARDLLGKGIDARNMKVLRRIADQEASLYEQVVTPAMRNRRPEARAQAVETLVEMAKLGRALRASYLRQGLRDVLREDR